MEGEQTNSLDRAYTLVPTLARPVEWPKIVARTCFEAAKDLARSDNTALLGAADMYKQVFVMSNLF